MQIYFQSKHVYADVKCFARPCYRIQFNGSDSVTQWDDLVVLWNTVELLMLIDFWP